MCFRLEWVLNSLVRTKIDDIVAITCLIVSEQLPGPDLQY